MANEDDNTTPAKPAPVEKVNLADRLDGAKPTNTLETLYRTFVLEGPKDVIEDTIYQMQVSKAFEQSDSGVYKFNGNKVTVTVK